MATSWRPRPHRPQPPGPRVAEPCDPGSKPGSIIELSLHAPGHARSKTVLGVGPQISPPSSVRRSPRNRHGDQERKHFGTSLAPWAGDHATGPLTQLIDLQGFYEG